MYVKFLVYACAVMHNVPQTVLYVYLLQNGAKMFGKVLSTSAQWWHLVLYSLRHCLNIRNANLEMIMLKIQLLR